MKRIHTKTSLALRLSEWIFIGLLAYMPLHIFLSTWLGTSFHILSVAKILKDLVMIAGFLLVLVSSVKQKWFKPLLREKYVWAILAYSALTLLLALVRPTAKDAEILGVIYNTRFFVFFLYAILLSRSVDYTRLRKNSLVAILGSALVVLSFGVLQYTVIPNNALSHVGYKRSNGVLPAFFIDDKPDLERIMSTLRDPNSLGSYLIIIGSIALAILLKKQKLKRLAIGFLTLTLLCLWFSFSRSAWIGFLASCFVVGFLIFRDKISNEQFKKLALFSVVTVVVLGGLFVAFRKSYFVQNVVFHADKSTVLEDPNQLRIRFWKESATTIQHNPLGSGPGTAGIVSIRNNVQGGKLNENYYLQIAQEAGIVGLILFMTILILVALRLFVATSYDWLAIALIASLAGLMITNFLVHIWSNEAVAYTWWGLAGLSLGFKSTLATKKAAKST